jgi:putative transposase
VKQKHHRAEQIVGMLRQAAAQVAQGQGIDQVCKAFGVSEATYYRWRKSYGSMPLDHLKRLKHLEKENSRLKRVVADLTLDKAILQEALQGNY